MAIGRPPKYETVEEMQVVIDSYFAECDEKQTPYTVTELATHLGMTRKTLCEYAKDDEFCNAVKRAREKVEASVEKRLLSGANATGAIFWLKNNAGWKDRHEHELDISDGFAELLKSARERRNGSSS